MSKSKIFVSHVAEEASIANILKSHLASDFLGFVDLFVSSDLESIRAGANFLTSIEEALKEASALVAICSRASLNRPWVNFEVGAAWMRRIPIVPVCHSGLKLKDLPIPFSLLQGIEANSEAGLKRIYSLVAENLECRTPSTDFKALASEIANFEAEYAPRLQKDLGSKLERQVGARDRVYKALGEQNFKWRSIERLAILGGITEDEVLDLLRRDPAVKLGKGRKSGNRIARLAGSHD